MCVRSYVRVRVRVCPDHFGTPKMEILRQNGSKRGSKWDIWFQVRDRSRPKSKGGRTPNVNSASGFFWIMRRRTDMLLEIEMLSLLEI